MDLISFIGMPGPAELIIIIMMLGMPVLVVVLILRVIRRGVENATRQDRDQCANNPNLFPCPDCGHYVSRLAPSCPQCGRTLTPQQDG